MRIPTHVLFPLFTAAAVMILTVSVASAQLVPGTGMRDERFGDDFEDPAWSYEVHWPKSSREWDGQVRAPLGVSANGKWQESRRRGTPEVVKRVETPAGGLPGSTGALRLQSLYTRIPHAPSGQGGQDDLLFNARMNIPVSRSPSIVVRVFLPPFEEWERNTGTSFGFRASVTGQGYGEVERRGVGRLFGGGTRRELKTETYYPGFFIQFNHGDDPQHEQDSAVLIIRGRDSGHDFAGPAITEPGWWTLGMSFTPDGRVHYYARPGVEDLRPQDHIASHFPYGFRANRLNTFFFNVCNKDDGKNWSTEWIIDDPSVYFGDTRPAVPQHATGAERLRR